MKSLITYNQHAVNKFTQFFNAFHCLSKPFFPFGRRRNSYHCNGENIEFAGKAAITGAAPVPVPPPIPAVINNILYFLSKHF